MDLRSYYRKFREIEKGIEDEYVVVKSLDTADGGITGRLTEVARALAAKMLADGVAELAQKGEASVFRSNLAEQSKQEEQKRAAAAKIQFAVLTAADLRSLQKPGRGNNED